MKSTIVFPSNDGWIAPRTTQAKIDTNNCMIILPQKIEKIKRVVVNGSTVYVRIRRLGIEAAESERLSSIILKSNATIKELDITDYVVELAKYNTLPFVPQVINAVITDLCTNNAHYYEHNGNDIYINGNEYKGDLSFFSVTAFNMAIQAAFNKLVGKEPFYLIRDIPNRIEYYADTGDISDNNALNNPMSAQFRVYYTPLGESVKLEVPKTNPQLMQFTIPYSQQQQIVSSVGLGREMQSKANRTGCETRQVVRTFPDFKYYRKPGAFWREKDANGNFTGNVWRLTECQLQIFHDNLFRVFETWSKNWTVQSQFVGINREFRSWNIPADIVQRNLLWQDYCLITAKDVELPDTCLMTDQAKREVLRGLETSYNEQADTECNNLWFYRKTATGGEKGAVMPCSTFGFGNSLVFSGKTKDNLSAGTQRAPFDANDTAYQLCKDVYYCEDDGTLDSMYIQLGSGIDVMSPYEYPLYLDDEYRVNKYPTATDANKISLFKERNFKVLKDPAEQLNFTYQLHLLTDNPYLVIGSTWAATNPLVLERKETKTVKVWKLSSLLSAGAQVMTSAYGSVYTGTDLFKVNAANNTITFAPVTDALGICVTDEDNNILVAYNNNDGVTLQLKYTHDYKQMSKLLWEQYSQIV